MNGFAELNARIAKTAGAPVQMDPKAFTAYVAEQVQKSQKDPADVQKARLAALEKASADAKDAFDKGGTTAPVTVFADPPAAVAAPAAAAVAAPAAGTEQAAAPAAGAATAAQAPTLQGLVEKGQSFGGVCAVLAKQLGTEASTLRTELAKSEPGKVTISKAASAVDTLRKVAMAFGINPDDPRYADGCERIAWKVEEVVRCLENAAKAEQAINGLAAAFGGSTDVAKSFAGLESIFARQSGTEPASWPSNLNEGRGSKSTNTTAKG